MSPFLFLHLLLSFFGAGVNRVVECRYHFTCVDIAEPQAEEISESNAFSSIFAANFFFHLQQMYIYVLHVHKRQAVVQQVS